MTRETVMAGRTILQAATVLLLAALPMAYAAAQTKPAPPPSNPGITRAEKAASEFGYVFGAAARCPVIDANRVRDAVVRGGDTVHHLALGPEDEAAANGRFDRALIAGGEAILNNRVNCGEIDARLRRIMDQMPH